MDRAAADPAVSDARRIPLCSESAYMSMGQFLSLAFGGLHLGTMDSGPLWEGRVLYLGLGRTVVAFHTERHKPQVVLLPALGLSYVPEKQAAWIRSEVEEVEAQATKAFDALKVTGSACLEVPGALQEALPAG